MTAQDLTFPSRRKRAVFRTVLLVLVCLTGLLLLGLAEWTMRWRRSSLGVQDVMDPRLIRYDPDLGWALNPGSAGGHTNSDFGTVYHVSMTGFRADSTCLERRPATRQIFLGDSFVFGLGVPEDETFVHRLNTEASSKGCFVNCGVPGFSTDQELLLLDSILRDLQPDVVWLVIYLANDLLDIRQGRAIQVNQPKPFFEWREGRLERRHSPVPRQTVESPAAAPDLAFAMLGPELCRNSWRISLERRFLLFQSLSDRWLSPPDVTLAIAERLPPALDLFCALIRAMEEKCEKQSVRMRVAFMPGRSMVQKPDSIPGQYQRLVLGMLKTRPELNRLAALDLYPSLVSANQANPGRLFFPNDGHLTREGHEVVAKAIASSLE